MDAALPSLNPNSLARACGQLAELVPEFSQSLSRLGLPPLWERRVGFQTLIHIILEQQVSIASAKACLDKLLGGASSLGPEEFLVHSDEALRGFGFSRQKALYCRNVAQDVLAGRLDLAGLASRSDDAVRQTLSQVKGIGRWTADVYLLMALLRPDIWPKGDVALATAYKEVFGRPTAPSQDELEQLAEAWRPNRSSAARILWHDYLSRRNRV